MCHNRAPTDIYLAEKEKIEKVVDEFRAKMIALETSLDTIKSQKDSAKIKFNELSLKLDAVINRQIESLEKKRQSLKVQLQEVAWVQKNRHETQEVFCLIFQQNKNKRTGFEKRKRVRCFSSQT